MRCGKRVLGYSQLIKTAIQSLPSVSPPLWSEIITSTPRLSQFSTSADLYSKLKVSDIQQLLQDSNVDFRDCYEKQELVSRLKESESVLPAYIRTRLRHMLSSSTIPSPDQARNEDLSQEEEQTVRLFNRCRHSVVHVTSFGRAIHTFSMNPVEIPQGTGTGIVWDNQGHLVTNFHVISRADQRVQVTLSDNSTLVASIKGVEPDKDLAVLKVDGKTQSLAAIEVGLSSNLRVGQRVFAIGNPFGLDQTLTAGIISGVGREIASMTGRVIRDVVQTDAAINPGNSGGPLLDSRGRMIGVNTAIVSPGSGTFAGIGFAIPSNTVRRIVNQLIRHGKIVKPRIGVFCANDSQSQSLLRGRQGVVVVQVEKGSPAEAAGIKGIERTLDGVVVNDVLVAVGGKQVVSVEDLTSFVEEFDVGDLVPITVDRIGQDGRIETLNLHVRTY